MPISPKTDAKGNGEEQSPQLANTKIVIKQEDLIDAKYIKQELPSPYKNNNGSNNSNGVVVGPSPQSTAKCHPSEFVVGHGGQSNYNHSNIFTFNVPISTALSHHHHHQQQQVNPAARISSFPSPLQKQAPSAIAVTVAASAAGDNSDGLNGL